MFSDNIAFGMKANQSSTAFAADEASKAVDGTRDTSLSSTSCSRTDAYQLFPNHWWSVELNGTYTIHSVTIFNNAEG